MAKASPTGFSGNLEIVPIMDVLEKVRNQRETGLLSVWTPMVKGSVWVRKGETVDAEVGVRRGIAALDLLGLLDNGSFAFEGRENIDGKVTIEMPSAEVVRRWKGMEGRCRTRLSQLPPLLDQVFWDKTREPTSVAQSEDGRAVLGRLRQGCTLLEVLVEVEQDIEVALEALVAASAAFDKRQGKEGDPSQPRNERESPRPVWTAPPPAARKSAPMTAEPSVGTLGGHLTSANPKRTFLLPSAPPAATPVPSPVEVSPAKSPNTGAAPTTKGRLGARTLLGVPPGDALAPPGGPTPGEPLDGIVGEMIEAAPETVRTSKPPKAEPAAAHARPSIPTSTVIAGSLAGMPLTQEAAPAAEPRVIPRAQWDGRRHVGGLLELGDKKLEKVRTLATGRFVCELVAESRGGDTVHWALKMPARPLPDLAAALHHEVRHLSRCRHHAVVEFGAAGTDVDVPYLLTRYHPSLTLTALVERVGKLPFEVATGVAKQVLQALVYLHDSARPQGAVVHGNLCPDNVLVGFDGVVKLCGFSSVRHMNEVPDDGDVRAHARYSSPELLRGETFDGRADVFSVGAMLKFLGNPPKGDRASAGQSVVARALETDVNVRYPSAAQMLLEMSELSAVASVQELAGWLARNGVAEGDERGVSPAAPVARGTQARGKREEGSSNETRRRRIIVVGVALLFAVVALLVFWMKG